MSVRPELVQGQRQQVPDPPEALKVGLVVVEPVHAILGPEIVEPGELKLIGLGDLQPLGMIVQFGGNLEVANCPAIGRQQIGPLRRRPPGSQGQFLRACRSLLVDGCQNAPVEIEVLPGDQVGQERHHRQAPHQRR